MLGNYREYAARVAFLEKEIPQLEKLVAELKHSIVDDEVNITQVISDMPHGSGISDPTGRLGAMIAEGFTPQRIVEIEQEISRKKSELDFKQPTVVFVDAWLMGLNARERFLIQRKVIDNDMWRNIIYDFSTTYGEHYSKEGLKRILDNGLTKIFEIAK